MTHAEPSLRERMSKGLLRTALGRVAVQVMQLGITVALARLLDPKDFGLMALMMAVLGVANLLSDAGLGTALVRRREVDAAFTSSIFWLAMALGAGWALLCVPLGLMLAHWYAQPVLLPMVMFGGLTFLFRGLATVPNSLLIKRLEFGRLNLSQIAAVLVAGAVAIVLAKAGAGVFSLVVQQVAQAGTFLLGVWAAAGWKPTRALDRSAIRETFSFSLPLLAFNITNYFARNIDDILVARRFGPAAVGLYSRAYQTMLLPLSQISAPLGAVLMPALAEMQDDDERLKRAYLRMLSLISLVTLPMMAGLAVVAVPFTVTLYGAKWIGMATLLPAFCLAGAVQSIETTVGVLFTLKGRTKELFIVGCAANAVLIVAIVLSIALGASLSMVVLAYAASSALVAAPTLYLAGRLVSATPRDLVRAFAAPAILSAVMGLLVFAVSKVLPSGWSAALQLLTLSALGAVAYVGSIHWLKLPAYKLLREEVQVAMRRAKLRGGEK